MNNQQDQLVAKIKRGWTRIWIFGFLFTLGLTIGITGGDFGSLSQWDFLKWLGITLLFWPLILGATIGRVLRRVVK